MRTFREAKLVIASHNPGKMREIAELLWPYAIDVVGAADLTLDEPRETDATFAANAALKAHAAARATGLPALGDDSGLAVTALGGQPGILSARWAGPDRDFGLAMARVNDELGDDPDRSARFVCALTLAWPDGDEVAVESTVDGTLVWPPRGSGGFGYDPIFVPLGHDVTFGEMTPAAKHALSHRADALAKLVAACFADAA